MASSERIPAADTHPNLIDLDSGDEYEWVGEGYAHEGDHDFCWSRGLHLAEVGSLDESELAELRARYAAGG